MKVAHLTSVHFRYDTRIFLKQCKSLSEHGFEVTLVVADGEGDEQKEGIQIIDAGTTGSRLSRIFIKGYHVIQKAKSVQADLYHLHDPELLLYALLLRRQGKKVIFDMHENLPKQILSKFYIKAPFRRILSFTIRHFQNLLFRSIPVVFAEESYPHDFPEIRKSVIVLNYPVLGKIKGVLSDMSKPFTVGYMGEISQERGALLLLSAVHQLRLTGQNILIKFVGPAREEVTSSEIYRVAIHEGWATFTGRLKPEEAWERISACHAGAAVFYPSPNFVDSLPTKLFEYMALGMPTLVSDFPLYREIVQNGNCGILVNPDRIEEVKNAILYFHTNREKSRQMGENGKNYVMENFNWEAEFRKLAVFYENC
ncbi:MAG: glycosyltransferase family 4 protein [Bacteroidales bacterium]|jgi:glycosyltransferase involved in cell wall biosynthesis|nr:glycosyltransferase family 4 protein [Bacteroidales bacterium]